MNAAEKVLSRIIFFSRWFQAPLYLGLIIALGIYVYEFAVHLWFLLLNVRNLRSTEMMLGVLDLIDVVMIANLMIMVIVGGYEIFVSRLYLQNHPDHPEWLDEVNAGSMKVKLALALIGISSIHLLRTFIDPSALSFNDVLWQVVIHITLVVSAIAIAIVGNMILKGKAIKQNMT